MKNRAVVIGAGMSGILAARVLAEHYSEVFLLEKDERLNGEPRTGVPQGAHFHALLARGHHIIHKLFPGLMAELISQGAVEVDVCEDFAWHHFGGWKLRFPTGEMGMFVSRPFLEFSILKALQNTHKNVVIETGCEVKKLMTADSKSVVGVEYVFNRKDGSCRQLQSDLVVDATGRQSKLPQWLADLGFEKPKEERVKVGVGYASRVFRRKEFPSIGKGLFLTPKPPLTKRTGGLFPIEDERWICTLGGWHGDHASRTGEGFLRFAEGLPSKEIFEIVSNAEPLSDIAIFKYPVARRLRYDRLRRFPKGLLPIGDSLCSFNPIYGQGMTVCAIEAERLSTLFKQNRRGLEQRFLRSVARDPVSVAWLLSTTEDFRFLETQGKRSFITKVAHWYVGRIHALAQRDRYVLWKFYEVMNMLKSPFVLFHPKVVFKVLFKSK